MRLLRKIFGRFWPLITIGILLVLFLGNAMNKDNETLNVYKGGNSTYTVPKETEAKSVPSFLYTRDDISLQMLIPEGWQKVTKDGYDTFIHSASASSIQVQVLTYYPMVNNASLESLTETYGANGFSVSDFDFMSTSSYYVIYQSQGMSGITDYIEHVYWDRQHVVKILVTVNDSNYTKLEAEIQQSLGSVQWECEDPVPEDLYINYQPYGDFEFAVPNGWVVGSTDEAFYAYDESYNAVLTVNVLEDSSSISDISELDYANFLTNNKANFALTGFEQSGNSIYGEATYISDNTQMGLMQYYYANGMYHYVVTYEFPTNMGEELVPVFREALNMTRVFSEPAVQETEQETELSMPEMPSIDEAFSDVGYEPETYASLSQDSVSTFTEALMNIAGISEEKAKAVTDIWYSTGAGDPVYAEVYRSDSSMIVILVNDSAGTDYYLTITADGDPLSITAGAEDGNVLYEQ